MARFPLLSCGVRNPTPRYLHRKRTLLLSSQSFVPKILAEETEYSRSAAGHLITRDQLHVDLGDATIKIQFGTSVSMGVATAGAVTTAADLFCRALSGFSLQCYRLRFLFTK